MITWYNRHADRRLFINADYYYGIADPFWDDWANPQWTHYMSKAWRESEPQIYREGYVSYQLKYALDNAERLRAKCAVWPALNKHYLYAFPERGPGRSGFWAIANTINMSVFEIKDGHVWDSRKDAVLITYEQLLTLREVSHSWTMVLPGI